MKTANTIFIDTDEIASDVTDSINFKLIDNERRKFPVNVARWCASTKKWIQFYYDKCSMTEKVQLIWQRTSFKQQKNLKKSMRHMSWELLPAPRNGHFFQHFLQVQMYF